MAEASSVIRVSDPEAIEMLEFMAQQDVRSMANFTAWLIRQEWARRYSQPNPVITIGEAVQANPKQPQPEEA